jgi:hypothetical protein
MNGFSDIMDPKNEPVRSEQPVLPSNATLLQESAFQSQNAAFPARLQAHVKALAI